MPIFKECQQLNLRLFECPSFLFVIMGIITIIAIIATYLIASQYAGPEVVISSVVSITIVILIIGHFVVRSVNRIAQAHQMQSEFISIASHQLRTPLSALKWTLEALLKTNLDTKQLNYAQMIRESNQRMLKLANDLLNVARIEQGHFELQKEKFELNELIKEVIEELKNFARASNVQLLFKPQTIKILADREKIKMVLESLVHNAIQYGSKCIIIDLNNNIISIQDDGLGIPKVQQKQVFQKFFRAHNILRHQTQGTGLGLYICQAIIEAHQGKIWFQSQENKGTTFYLSLPSLPLTKKS